MGSLSPTDQKYLAENFLAFFKRDYRKVAELHIESGWIPANTRIDEFESAIRCVCEPIFEKPLKDISFGETLLRLFQTARRFNMEIQPQLILLQKTLISVEGLARQLYPDLDLWNTARPFLENWAHNKFGSSMVIAKIKNKAPIWLEKLPEVPQVFFKAAQQIMLNNISPTHIVHENKQQRDKFWSVWKGFFLGVSNITFVIAFISYYNPEIINNLSMKNLSLISIIICLSTLFLAKITKIFS